MATLVRSLITVGSLCVLTATSAMAQLNTYSDPKANTLMGTYTTGISGDTVYGYYIDKDMYSQGFFYDGTKYTEITSPKAYTTSVAGILGKNVYGTYQDIASNTSKSFVYDGSTFRDFNLPNPGVKTTNVVGVSGNDIYGTFTDSGGKDYAFVSDGTNFKKYSVPGIAPGYSLNVTGLDGRNMVGWYRGVDGAQHNFVYDIFSSSIADIQILPDAYATVSGIYGNYAYGSYSYHDPASSDPWSTFNRGFIYDIAQKAMTEINSPNADQYNSQMTILGVSDTKVVGSYQITDADGWPAINSFVYDILDKTYKDFSLPVSGSNTQILGISGTTLYGSFMDDNGNTVGYTYDDGSGGLLGFSPNASPPGDPVPEPGNVGLLVGMIVVGGGLWYRRRKKVAAQVA